MKLSAMKLGMIACCTVMFIPLVGYFVAGGTFALNGSTLTAALPLVACLAVHGVMFAVMGKSCHGDKKTKATEEPSTVGKQAVVSSAALTRNIAVQ
jgi:hypothetical protein